MKWKKKWRYRLDTFISKGTFSLILMLFGLTFLFVVTFGVIAYFVGSENSLLHTIWTSFMQTLDAGNLSDEEGSFTYVLFMTFSTIGGIFVTSALISFISNGFQSKLENLQKGVSEVIEMNHTLILGYNENVLVIVKEIINANTNQKKGVIVILTEKDMSDTLTELKSSLKHFMNTKIIVRTGSIFDKDALQRCAIDSAKNVIIASDSDPLLIKSLLAISQTKFFKNDNDGYISAIVQEEKNIRVAKSIGKDKIEIIHFSDAMNRIMSQTCLQPGLSFIYKDVLDFTGDEFYFYHHQKKLTGLRFQDILNRFRKSLVVGIFRKKRVLLNPDKDTLIEDEDFIICISEDDDTIFLDYTEAYHPVLPSNTSVKKKNDNRNIVCIGYNDATLDVVCGFEPYLHGTSHITFLLNHDENQAIEERMKTTTKMTHQIIVGKTCDRDTLESLPFDLIDTAIVFSNPRDDEELSDSETLLSVLHLREIEKDRHLDIQIVIEIRKIANADNLQFASIDDFVVSNILSNKMLAQVSENRYLNPIFQELLSAEGCEIYLKPVSKYIRTDAPVAFESLVRLLSDKQEIILGYKKKSEKKRGGIHLNPAKDEWISFEAGDCLIVLSEEE